MHSVWTMCRRKKAKGRKLLDMMSRSQIRRKTFLNNRKQAKKPLMHRYRIR